MLPQAAAVPKHRQGLTAGGDNLATSTSPGIERTVLVLTTFLPVGRRIMTPDVLDTCGVALLHATKSISSPIQQPTEPSLFLRGHVRAIHIFCAGVRNRNLSTSSHLRVRCAQIFIHTAIVFHDSSRHWNVHAGCRSSGGRPRCSGGEWGSLALGRLGASGAWARRVTPFLGRHPLAPIFSSVSISKFHP